MAKAKSKVKAKPKIDKQVMDGLDVSFEEAMSFLAQRSDKKEEQSKKAK
jgi:hypothetical protein